jgi:hypothetical protein
MTLSAATVCVGVRFGAADAGITPKLNMANAVQATATDFGLNIYLRVTEKALAWSISLKAIACFNLFQNQKRSRSQ